MVIKDKSANLEFQKALRKAVMLPSLLGLAIAVFFLWEVQTLRDAMQWLDHTDQVLSRANRLERLFVDAETGMRGFNINGNKNFLEPYNGAIAGIPSEIKSLENFVSDNPPQEKRLKEIEVVAARWFDLARESIKLRSEGAGVATSDANSHGKILMDTLRGYFSQFVSSEENLRFKRNEVVQRSSRLAILAGSLLGLLIGGIITFNTRRLLSQLATKYEKALDVATQKASELYESREWFQTTLTSIGDAVIVVNKKAEVSFLNPVAEKLTGWTREEAIGLPMSKVFDIVNEKTRRPAFNPVERVLSEGIVVGLANHTVLIGKNRQEYPIEDSAAPIKDPNGQTLGVILVFRDVTEKHLSESSLRQSEENYRNIASNLKEALRSRDDFLSIASHELKTPLTTLKLQLQMGLRSIKPDDGLMPTPEKMKKVIETCHLQTERLNILIDGLLDVTRIQHGKLQFHFESANILEIVRRSIEQLSNQLDAAKCQVKIEASEAVIAMCDIIRMEQVVTNLVNNAMKYAAGHPIHIKISKEDRIAVITVTDFGIGIPEEKHNLIFERFERAIGGNEVSGLGLGLYIVKQIITGHDGLVEVQSEINKGSTFTVRFPIRTTKNDFSLIENELKKNSI